MHHPKADTDGLHGKGKEAGRGLLQTESTYKAEIINIAEYLNTKCTEDQFLNIDKHHEINQPYMNSTIKVVGKVAEELNQSNVISKTKKEGIQHIKAKLGQYLKKKWESKVVHGQYIRSMDRQLTTEEETFLWLSRGDLKGETESEITPAQGQALQTKYNATKILQTETDSKCRLCKQFDETVKHILSACPVLAKEHIKRHDTVCAQLNVNICKEIGGKSRQQTRVRPRTEISQNES